jgi:hypothetical protein
MGEYTDYSNYTIHIGSSETKNKQIYIRTELTFGINFIQNPFGKTKTRFQHTNMFECILIMDFDKNTSSDKYNYYTLNITKINPTFKNCPYNSDFFSGDGWNLNLYITNIPTENIYMPSLIPENYGQTIFQLPKPDKYRVGIIIPVFNRSEYLSRFLKSLNQCDMTDCLIIFVDESMTKDVNEDKHAVRNMIEKYICPTPDKTGVIKIFKRCHGNMFDSILIGLDIVSHFCDYACTIDSDTIHKPNWIAKCLQTYTAVKIDHPNKPILISGFNTVNANRHNVLEKRNEYTIKNTVGGCTLFFSSEIYFSIIRFTLNSYKWDTNLVQHLKKIHGGVIAVTNPSVVDHIGLVTSGHRYDAPGALVDTAVDF